MSFINFILSLFRRRPPIIVDGYILRDDLVNLTRSVTQFIWAFDGKYLLTEQWADIFSDVLFNLPYYIEDTFDCDDYAWVVKARVAEKYQINSIGLVLGNTPAGYHAWNCFYLDGDILYLEPQTGEIWEPSNGDYKADWVIW